MPANLEFRASAPPSTPRDWRSVSLRQSWRWGAGAETAYPQADPALAGFRILPIFRSPGSPACASTGSRPTPSPANFDSLRLGGAEQAVQSDPVAVPDALYSELEESERAAFPDMFRTRVSSIPSCWTA